ncbi:MAG: hypothetical protein JWO33_2654 [Caulobacteraceae bacterium]|nr:hypothetical protein [Caulobacteraceae bacterium]
MMAVQRRTLDRAQRMRARRQWWERNGAFARGLLTGLAVMAIGGLLVWGWLG